MAPTLRKAGIMSENSLSEDTNLFAGRQDVRLFADGKALLYVSTVCVHEAGK